MSATETPQDFPDGIYYDMPENIYHAIPRLSSSGVRNLMISPMTFWARSWLNPDRESAETQFTSKGRAYHARIVEGSEAFESRFAYELDAKDFPDALKSTDDLKEWIRQHNERTGDKIKIGGNKPELMQRILEADPEVEIWDNVLKQYAEALPEGVSLISGEWKRDLELGAGYVEKHPTVRKCFIGGAAEVSILWTHEVMARDGSGEIIRVKMKARVDRLKSNAMIDFKTYGNPLDKSPQRAIIGAMASRKYHVQAAIYYKAEDAAVAAGWLPEAKQADGAKGRQFVFVFQGTWDDPSPYARIMDRRMTWVDLGARALDLAALTFDEMMRKFGADPWLQDEPLQHFSDEDFPLWASD